MTSEGMARIEAARNLTAGDLIASWYSQNGMPVHPQAKVCRVCQEDLSRVAVVKVAMTVEPCECGPLSKAHLVDQVWHRTCFAKREGGSWLLTATVDS